MKDLLILGILVCACAWALRRPWTGVIGWTVTSLGSPHVEFGYSAATWPVAMAIGSCTLIGLLATKDRQNPMIPGGTGLLLAFVVWTCITLPFSVHFDWSIPLWQRSLKIYLMLFVTLALITDRRKLQIFIWANVASIAYFGVKGGVFTLVTGGNYRVWGPGGFIEGNNEVALAVLAVVPLLRYLQTQTADRRIKMAMTGAMALCVITALGTYSRGALVGLGAMGFFFWLRGGNKLVWGVLVVVIGVLALSIMPEQWWNRMNSIKTYDADASAMGRINAWWMAFNLAKDRLFGGGFMVSTADLFAKYAPDPTDVHAAHSIYFQVLGEHGFIGLALFLSMGVATWFTASKLVRIGRKDPSRKWAAELGAMVQVSVIAYGTAGAFLSLAYFDLPYNVMVIAALALKFCRQAGDGVPGPAQTGAPTPATALPGGVPRPAERS